MGWVVTTVLRPAEPEDEEYAFQVRKASFAAYGEWDEEAERRLHARRFREHDYYIVTNDFEPVGVMVYNRTSAGIVLHQLFLEPEKQGRGTGTVCMRKLIEEAGDARLPISLRVRKDNPRALYFYAQLQFRITDENSSHYQLTLDPYLRSSKLSNKRPSTS